MFGLSELLSLTSSDLVVFLLHASHSRAGSSVLISQIPRTRRSHFSSPKPKFTSRAKEHYSSIEPTGLKDSQSSIRKYGQPPGFRRRGLAQEQVWREQEPVCSIAYGQPDCMAAVGAGDTPAREADKSVVVRQHWLFGLPLVWWEADTFSQNTR